MTVWRPQLFHTAFATLGYVASTVAVIAGESAVALMQAGIPADCAAYAANVSKSEGNFGSENQHGCVGAFQFCPGTFESYYSGSRQDFKNDPEGQVKAWLAYQKDEWGKAQRNGLTSAIGQSICYRGSCATITESSILKACQFGCGARGKLANLVSNGYDCEARNVKDGNLKSVCAYMIDGAGFNASCITGNSSNSQCPPGTVPATNAQSPQAPATTTDTTGAAGAASSATP